MSSQNPKHDTQLYLQGLTDVGQSTGVTEPEGHAIEGQTSSQDRSVLKKNAPKRKRELSPQRSGAVERPGIRAYHYEGMKDESPWESYWKIFQLKFDRFVTVAVRKEPFRERVVVKSFSGPDSQEELRMIHNTRHDNIVAVLETFRFDGSFYVILERMGISLLQIVASPPYPGEQELAAISGQVGQTDQQLRSIC